MEERPVRGTGECEFESHHRYFCPGSPMAEAADLGSATWNAKLAGSNPVRGTCGDVAKLGIGARFKIEDGVTAMYAGSIPAVPIENPLNY